MKNNYNESVFKMDNKGITLIALIITIVIMLVLTTITINTVNQNQGSVDLAINSTEKYVITNDKEDILSLLQEIVKKHEIKGEDINLAQIANEMSGKSWVKNATVNQDIIVTTEKGYVYELYYNDNLGQTFIEYLGREDTRTLPTITMTYNEDTKNISVTSSEADKIELMRNERVLETANGTSLSYTAQKNGWYEAKVTSSNGKIKYAWIRTAEKNIEISIQVTSNGLSEKGWYGKDNVPVQVTISTPENKIYYKTGAEDEFTEVLNNQTTLTVGDTNNEIGKTTIYAYAEDTNGNESEVSILRIRYDNIKPQVGEIVTTGIQEYKNWFTSDIIISLPNMTDADSGVDGYYYWDVNNQQETNGYIRGTTKTVIVSSYGRKELAFQAKDNAGNLSDVQTLTVKKVRKLKPGEMAFGEDGLYKGIIIPSGFTVSNITGEYESVDNGIVIYDIPRDDLLNGGNTFWAEIGDNNYLDVQENYNQFVWVPVEKAYIEASEDITTYTGAAKPVYPMAVKLSNGNYRGILYDFAKSGDNVAITAKEYSSNPSESYDYNVSGYKKYNREPGMISPDYNNGTPKYSVSQTSLQTEYNSMVESVDEYGGFYVARYEMSYASKAESKRNKDVTTASNNNTKMWYGLYDACKAMYNPETYNVYSEMITGAQYDQIMVWMKDVPNGSKKFILDSSDMGNYGLLASVQKTGSSNNYCVKDIFDIAGNVEEWTTEAYDVSLNNARVARGGRKGVLGSTDPATDRIQSSNPTYTAADQVRSSRATLYIKMEQ